MFSASRLTGQGQPLTRHAMVVALIGHTRTKPSLSIPAALNMERLDDQNSQGTRLSGPVSMPIAQIS